MGPNDFMHYSQIVDDLIDHCRQYHFTHVEVMPLSEFPLTVPGAISPPGTFPAPPVMERTAI